MTLGAGRRVLERAFGVASTVRSVISRSRLGHLVYEHLDASGVPVEPPSSSRVPTSLDAAAALGALVATTHDALDHLDLKGDDDPWPWSLTPSSLAGDDSGWLQRGLHGSDDALALLLEWRAQAIERLPQDTEPEGLCHGEVYPASCRHREDGTLAISELGWVGPGWREYDLATFLWVARVHRPDDASELFDEFITGYQSVRPAPLSERLTAWIAVRHLWSLRLAIGFEGPTQFARRADFARRWPIT